MLPLLTKVLLFGFPLLVIILSGSALAVAADNSKPGDPLFGLDRGMEQIERMNLKTDGEKASYEIDRVDERLVEIEQLILTKQGADQNCTNLKVGLSLFQASLSEANTKIAQTSQDSEVYQNLLAELAKRLAHHQKIWQLIVQFVPVCIQDGFKQSYEEMIVAINKALAALPEGRRNDLIKELQMDQADLQKKVNSSTSNQLNFNPASTNNTSRTITPASQLNFSFPPTMTMTGGPQGTSVPNPTTPTTDSNTGASLEGGPLGSGFNFDLPVNSGVSGGTTIPVLNSALGINQSKGDNCTGLSLMGTCMGQ